MLTRWAVDAPAWKAVCECVWGIVDPYQRPQPLVSSCTPLPAVVLLLYLGSGLQGDSIPAALGSCYPAGVGLFRGTHAPGVDLLNPVLGQAASSVCCGKIIYSTSPGTLTQHSPTCFSFCPWTLLTAQHLQLMTKDVAGQKGSAIKTNAVTVTAQQQWPPPLWQTHLSAEKHSWTKWSPRFLLPFIIINQD